MIAAMMPMKPAATDAMLTTPPRFLAESDSRMPMIPRTMAATASSMPKVAPWKKLATAAMIARIDGMLKLDLVESLMVVCAFSCPFEHRSPCLAVK